MTIKLISFQSI